MSEPPTISHGCEKSLNATQPHSTNTDNPSLDRVIHSLEKSTLREQIFHETYYSHMLTTPSHKEGTLVFHPPSRLEKHVMAPTEESFIADGDSLLYENPSRKISHTFSLHEYPALATLIEGLRALFSGESEQLRHIFKVSMAGTADAWELNLSPISQSTEDGVNCIRLTGEQTDLRTIAIEETNGDRSVLQLNRQVP